LENLIPLWVGVPGVDVPFDLGAGDVSEDEGDDLAFDEVKVYGCRKTQMALAGEVQELYVDLGSGNAVGYALGDISKIKGEVLGDEESLVVEWGVADNGAVWEDVGVVFVASIVECGCDFDPEGDDTSDHLNRRRL
jgi:hypothetical protein